MKKVIWKLVLPITVISFMVFTKWWYVLVVDGPDEILTGFPLPFVCSGWHTSLSLQIFIIEFVIDFMVYFTFWFLIFYSINKYFYKIEIPKFLNIVFMIIASLIIIWNALWVGNPDNIFYIKRDFEMEVMESRFKFVWQKQERPDFYKYHPEYRNDPKIPKSVIQNDWMGELDSIDKESLIDFGEFLTDKRKVYYKFKTSCGIIIIELKEADRNTFETFGTSIYSKDKNYIFDSRHGILKQADRETFQAINIKTDDGRIAYGKDKNNYYFWDEIVIDTVGFGLKMKEITKAQQ